MESNHSLSSYPDSGDSSPRSREIDCDNNNPTSWDEPTAAASKVKLMCSYGGRIQPRTHDNQLSYVGGATKILAVDRSIRFPSFNARLAALLPPTSGDVCFKYQLPGEDLDALISVTNDEDLEHMMLEYDRLLRPADARPAPRLRLFLFPVSNAEQKQLDRHWFVEALNSPPPVAPLPADPVTSPSPAAIAPGPDFLFGLDKGFVPPPAVKVKDPAPELPPLSVVVPAKEDRPIGGESAAVSPAEIQRQIQELQRMQIAAENQEMQRMHIAAGNQELQRMQIAAENQEMQRMQIAAGNQELQRMHIAAAENQEFQKRMQIAAAAAENQELQQRMQIAAVVENQELQQRMKIAAAAENQELQQRMHIAAAAENQELQQRMHIAAAAENQQQHPQATAAFQRNNSDDALAGRVLTAGGDYYLPRVPEKTAPTAVTQIPAGYWAEQRVSPQASSRYASVVGGGEPPLYVMPGPFAGGAAYYAAVPRMVPSSEAYHDGAAMYAMGHQPAAKPFADGRGGGSGAPPQPQVGMGGGESLGYTVAYDSAGRAVYYTGSVVPGAYHHQQTVSTNMGPVNPGGLVEGSKIPVKPPQVS